MNEPLTRAGRVVQVHNEPRPHVYANHEGMDWLRMWVSGSAPGDHVSALSGIPVFVGPICAGCLLERPQ